MPAATPSLWVAASDRTAFLKVCGRATFTQSTDFKKFAYELLHRGYREFLIDLSECLIMDSTFLGVLAGFGQKASESPAPNPPVSITLLNANPRITDLLDNLGVRHLFLPIQTPSSQETAAPDYQPAQGPSSSKEELARTCLEAHETLMKINPANIPKFKDVTRFFAEDLDRLKNQASMPNDPRNPPPPPLK